MQRMNDPAYLHTVSMNDLYETVFQSRPPVINGLLYSGTYLFAGAPKVGKSFFMAQLAYHISTGQKLWDYDVHQGTVLYLALEDDYQRLQERMSRMFGVEGTDSLHFAVYILSAVMHADERNRAMSDALGQDVYHYHLHVVYVPVVEKEIKWTRRCKDPSLVGKVKERITQVSMSKKWESQPVLGVDGEPLKTKTGKAILKQSYSVLQDDFFEYMRAAGYTDVERGERGSSEEHLTVTQFKVLKEQERLSELQETKTEIQSEIAELQEAHAKESEKLDKAKKRIQKQKLDLKRIDEIEAKPTLIGNKVTVDKDDFDMVITAAKKHITQEKKDSTLQKALDAAHKMIAELKNTVADLTRKLAAATKELSEYKSVRGKLRTADLEQENDRLLSRLRTYEDVISRNNLWSYFSRHRGKTPTKDDAR